MAPQLMGGVYPRSRSQIIKLHVTWPHLLCINLAQELAPYTIERAHTSLEEANLGTAKETQLNLETLADGPTFAQPAQRGQITILNYPVVDGHSMAFGDMISIVEAIDSFISRGTNHGVFVHCKHGKGRTGTVLAAYLMKKLNCDVQYSNAVLAKRHRIYLKGVTVKCQLKYLEYWSDYLHERDCCYASTDGNWIIEGVQVNGYKGWTYEVELAPLETCGKQTGIQWQKIGKLVSSIKYDARVAFHRNPDVCLQVKVKGWLLWTLASGSFNMIFETSANRGEPLVIDFNDLDGYRGTNHKGKKTFNSIQFWFKRAN